MRMKYSEITFITGSLFPPSAIMFGRYRSKSPKRPASVEKRRNQT